MNTEPASRSALTSAGRVGLFLARRWPTQLEQHGRSTCVQEGGWAIYDTTRHYAVANPDRSDHLIVMLPLHRFAGSAAQTGAALARPVGGAAGISRVVLQAMRSTYQERPHMGAEAAHGAGELVQLSLQEAAGQPGPEARRAALQDRIRLLVRQRLAACMRDLQSPAQAQRTATDIALGWGFNSSAHFSRAFRQHTGEVPSEYRRRCAAPR